ncbi:hypothetical protein ADK41_20620 [Streptomyces caelestis]|uniref:Uncharacterized protein n=2 Tax=Streptomyces TaxID=1883 RepID=A0A0M8QH92_9ACTN|nr:MULTISPECIES: hypothetical protein [Streptomyces]KOT37268.1 hypothetical protein ADK41_20620 [Streptomyces caelestis]KOV35530.1 hypothetical protein ADK58_03275 [Streptomyces sp. XY152]
MLATVDRPNTLVALPTARRRPDHRRGGPITTEFPTVPSRPRTPAAPSRPRTPADTTRTDVLRIISDPRTPTYVTEYANGRRRYSYWRPLDSATGTGGCYAALPTAECDALHEAGRITLGEPVVDPNRTTYRVRPASRVRPAPRAQSAARPEPAVRARPEPVRPVRERARVA